MDVADREPQRVLFYWSSRSLTSTLLHHQITNSITMKCLQHCCSARSTHLPVTRPRVRAYGRRWLFAERRAVHVHEYQDYTRNSRWESLEQPEWISGGLHREKETPVLLSLHAICSCIAIKVNVHTFGTNLQLWTTFIQSACGLWRCRITNQHSHGEINLFIVVFKVLKG